ncbi:hypothetical protein [Flavisolibacter nicotianae]|uniref:hypothetical protein n=1 Tax=Flavisolibacter nicotianae TaxID=2364882 RepID=UPI0013C4232D|nr:hypothetical protein [Flavisolibacter nicotianae]
MNPKLWRPILVNAVLVAVIFLVDLASQSPTYFFPRYTFTGMFMVLLTAGNFLFGMIRNRNRKGDGHYYFLISGVLLLIGFSVCSYL